MRKWARVTTTDGGARVKTKYDDRPMVAVFQKWFVKRLNKGKVELTYKLANGTVKQSEHANTLVDAFYLGVDEERARLNVGYVVGSGPHSVSMTISELSTLNERYPTWGIRHAYQHGSDAYYKHKNRAGISV
jgi:hypothetical protein